MTLKTKKIIQQIARQNGVTSLEVESQMNEAIRIAMSTSDPKAQQLWKQISPDGTPPSIDTFLAYCSKRVDSLIFEDSKTITLH